MEDNEFEDLLQAGDSDYKKLCNLVEEMSTTGRKELNEKHLKMLKATAKKSDQNVKHVFHLLMTQLGKFHAEIRFSVFQIIDQLFTRSHLFRMLLLEVFQHFLELTVDINKDLEFPPPSGAAKDLKLLALQSVSKWDEQFGGAYQKLRLGCNYLKKVKKIEFANVRAQTMEERRQVEAEEKRQEIVMNRKVEIVKHKMEESQLHIESCIMQAENCLRLLVPNFDNLEMPEGLENSEKKCSTKATNQGTFPELNEEGCGSSVGIRNMSYSITINFSPSVITVVEDENNSILLRTISDLHNEVVKHHLPLVKQWIMVLTKSGKEYEHLQRAMDLKAKLMQVNDKYNELNVVSKQKAKPSLLVERDLAVSDEESTDDEFQDVPENPAIQEAMISAEKKQGLNGKELRSTQPLPGSSHTFESSASSWSLSLNTKLTKYGKEAASGKQRANWKCRAPLASGLLCERQDLVKCPFHGKIVARDSFGTPSDPDDYSRDAEVARVREQKKLDELQRDIELAQGLTLSSDPVGRKKLKAARYARLTNLEDSKKTTRNRLQRKVLSKKALTKVAQTLDGIDSRRNSENYGCNFNYR